MPRLPTLGLGLCLLLLPLTGRAAEPDPAPAPETAPAPAPAPETAPDSDAAPVTPANPATPTHAEAPPAAGDPSLRTLIVQGRHAEALARLDVLLARSPHDDELRLQRARLLYWLGRLPVAEREVAAVRERHPQDIDATELHAQVLLASGDPRGALTLYRELERLGDTRPETHQRVIDLLVELEELRPAREALAYGGTLSDEQELRVAGVEHPWTAGASTALVLHQGQLWPRYDAIGAYRFSRQFSLLAGVYGEERLASRAFGAKAEGYFGLGPLSAMLAIGGSPSGTFLPKLDTRADFTWQFVPWFAAGAYTRFARYDGVDTVSAGPDLSFTLRSWTVTPGYLAVIATPHFGAGSTIEHTGYLKLRWQATARTAGLLWTYVGQDSTYVERFGPETATGVSALIGVDHWFTGRWGTRISLSRSQPTSSEAFPYTELSIGVRGRL